MKRLSFLVLTLPLLASAQNEFYVDGASVTVQNGALLYVGGSITITNGGIITNEGDIRLTGNWTNNVAGGLTYSGGSTNTVQFIGSGTQVIGGSQSTTFNNLTFNGPTSVRIDINTSAGGTGSGLLALNSTELNLNSLTFTVTNPATGAITRTTGYVLSESQPASYGYLNWQIGTGTGTYTIPFGTSGSTAYIPFVFTVTSGGTVSSTGSLAVATYPTNASSSPNNSPWPTGTSAMTDAYGNPLWAKIADRFWVANYSGYSTNPTSTYTFYYQDANPNDLLGTNTLVESNLKATYYGGPGSPTGWAPWPQGSDDATNNNVTGVAGVNFSAPWLLIDPDGQVLPITLLTFDAVPVDNRYINVHWTTTHETDNRGFELQRGTDPMNFESIAWIDGQGTTTVQTDYSYDDHRVVPNVIYYYRLKQVNFDGSISYSPIEPASIAGSTEFTIGEFYPNPTFNLSSIDITSPTDAVMTVEVYDVTGRLVRSSAAYLAQGANTLNLNLDHFSHGAYMVRLAIGNQSFSKRLVKLQ